MRLQVRYNESMDGLEQEQVLHALNRQSPHEDLDPSTTDEVDQRDDVGTGHIRCPKCAWRPRRSDTWECSCGWEWNTFDTRGRCPRCAFQWMRTQCLTCGEWSLHDDWYETDASGEKPG